MNYKCLPTNIFTYQDYRIEPYREEDMYLIQQWRNEQMDVLRQNRNLTAEEQERYYRGVVYPAFSAEQPRMILFSFMRQDVCIGYGGLTNIDWHSGRAEISFLVNTTRALDETVYREDFSAFLHLMKHVTFDALQFNRLFTETYDIRSHHIGILEFSGFRFEGRMQQHVFIQGKPIDSLIHGYLKEYYDAEQ